MRDAETYLRTFLQAFATPHVVPTVEADPDSVWVVEDDAPGGVAGYYKKVYVAPSSRILRDGSSAIFRFARKNIEYEIRVSAAPTYDENLDTIADVVRTLEEWISLRILERPKAYTPFIRDDPNAWWNVLGISINAGRVEIERAYREAAKISHPDAGGTHEAFLRVQRAYREAISSL
jgi:hypothetical protein